MRTANINSEPDRESNTFVNAGSVTSIVRSRIAPSSSPAGIGQPAARNRLSRLRSTPCDKRVFFIGPPKRSANKVHNVHNVHNTAQPVSFGHAVWAARQPFAKSRNPQVPTKAMNLGALLAH